ncbi:unnamed protein product [Lactuca virosa]|uniref:Uncharacterized protein n=1 Tax=Lactuca virosa TaxID=75947 RepID=A0AAU9N3I5_9ASTR|nr:unnamed protein product [Lactuca virosa]
MNNSYEPPPTMSSGALRSLKTDYPEEVQPTVAGVYGTEAPAPIYPAEFISSQQQIQAVGQRGLAPFEVVIQPPQEAAVRVLIQSSNQLSANDNRESVETDGAAAGSLSGFVHKNNSAYGIVVDPYSNGEGPGFSGFAERERSNNGTSTVITQVDTNYGHSMTGNNFRNAYKQLNLLYTNDEPLVDDE